MKNIDLRLEYIREKTPNVKFFLNVGGSEVGLGRGREAYLSSGYSAPSYFGFNRADALSSRNANYGLLQYFHSVGLPVASMLNIRSLAAKYGIAYDPDYVATGRSNAYYAVTYSPVCPIIALCISPVFAVVYFVLRKRRPVPPMERNYILR